MAVGIRGKSWNIAHAHSGSLQTMSVAVAEGAFLTGILRHIVGIAVVASKAFEALAGGLNPDVGLLQKARSVSTSSAWIHSHRTI